MADIVITGLGPLWTLDEVKMHLRVEGDDEDDLITAYMDAAEKAMLRFCNIAIVPFGQEAVFKVAGMIAVTSFYDDRLADDTGDGLPSRVRKLIWPHRWLPI